MPKDVIICDIDGTIADLSHRLHYIRPDHPAFTGKKNWPAFHAGCAEDAPHEDVRLILWTLAPIGVREVVYVSGRNDVARSATEEWLRVHNFPIGKLMLRVAGDYRSDDIVKEEILDRMGLTPERVLCVLDDRQRVVDMWRRRGFRVLQVAAGDF
jgi:hypothetical protein